MGKAVNRTVPPVRDGEPAQEVPFVSWQSCWDYVRFIRERVTPLLGPYPDLLRCIRTDYAVRKLLANAMTGGETLEQPLISCRTQQIALWLWTSESEGRDLSSIPNPGSRSGSPRFYDGQYWQ